MGEPIYCNHNLGLRKIQCDSVYNWDLEYFSKFTAGTVFPDPLRGHCSIFQLRGPGVVTGKSSADGPHNAWRGVENVYKIGPRSPNVPAIEVPAALCQPTKRPRPMAFCLFTYQEGL